MRKIQPAEVWLRAFEAIIGASTPSDSRHGTIGRAQVDHAFDRADETVEAFRARFVDEEDE